MTTKNEKSVLVEVLPTKGKKKRKPGRPKGSKNKSTTSLATVKTTALAIPKQIQNHARPSLEALEEMFRRTVLLIGVQSARQHLQKISKEFGLDA